MNYVSVILKSWWLSKKMRCVLCVRKIRIRCSSTAKNYVVLLHQIWWRSQIFVSPWLSLNTSIGDTITPRYKNNRSTFFSWNLLEISSLFVGRDCCTALSPNSESSFPSGYSSHNYSTMVNGGNSSEPSYMPSSLNLEDIQVNCLTNSWNEGLSVGASVQHF